MPKKKKAKVLDFEEGQLRVWLKDPSLLEPPTGPFPRSEALLALLRGEYPTMEAALLAHGLKPGQLGRKPKMAKVVSIRRHIPSGLRWVTFVGTPHPESPADILSFDRSQGRSRANTSPSPSNQTEPAPAEGTSRHPPSDAKRDTPV